MNRPSYVHTYPQTVSGILSCSVQVPVVVVVVFVVVVDGIRRILVPVLVLVIGKNFGSRL